MPDRAQPPIGLVTADAGGDLSLLTEPADAAIELPDAASPPDLLASPDLALRPPLPPRRPPHVGDPCKAAADCGTGLQCVQRLGLGKLPGGYCTQDCSTTACPTDSTCIKGQGFALCAANCPPATCREGYHCCAGTPVCEPTTSCQ